MPCAIIGSSGDGGVCGKGGNSSGLDEGGVAGSGPKYCCDKSISLALSDLCTPVRKPNGREGRVVDTCATAISPRNRALILFSICRNGAALVPSLSSSLSSSIGGANSRRGVDVKSPLILNLNGRKDKEKGKKNVRKVFLPHFTSLYLVLSQMK